MFRREKRRRKKGQARAESMKPHLCVHSSFNAVTVANAIFYCSDDIICILILIVTTMQIAISAIATERVHNLCVGEGKRMKTVH